jgi:predicted metal-dependent peptidase
MSTAETIETAPVVTAEDILKNVHIVDNAYKIRNIHPKIVQSIEQMLLQHNLGYYAEFLAFVAFYETNYISTAGVNVGLRVNYYYNKKFFDSLNPKQVNFVNIHEIFHLLLDHPSRTISGGYDHKMANIVQDMIINYIIITSFSKHVVEVPDIKPLFIPEEYKGEHIFEILYIWLQKEKEKFDKWENSKDNSPCPVSEQLKTIFDNLNNEGNPMDIGQFDEHMKNENIPEEVRRQVVKDIMNNLRNRGYERGDVTSVLDKLIKSRENYIKLLKKQFSNIKEKSKVRSFTRPNRHGFKGVKGKINHSDELVCILDTSGSMHGMFERIISYMLHGDHVVNVIQIDTRVNSHTIAKTKSDFQKLKIAGGGGTEIQPAIDYVRSHKKLKELNLVILTDGYTDELNLTGIPQTLIISCGTKCHVKEGNVQQVVIQQ